MHVDDVHAPPYNEPVRYRCLLIDHDDTAVDSTEAVHYPAHIEALRELRPERILPTKEQWLVYNFHGIMDYLEGELRMTPAEMVREFEIWRSWTGSHTPPFFPGFLDLLIDYRRQGGLVAVISHSEVGDIERHYRAARQPAFVPDLIFGWEHDPARRKPNPWPVQEALARFGCAAEDALVVDDLKPGVIMARAAGVDFAAAGWSHRVAEIETYMRAHAEAYCPRIEDLRSLVIPADPGAAGDPSDPARA
jgi:beta-phosphoglucomutase-like phosphatase (HAD superfamily)